MAKRRNLLPDIQQPMGESCVHCSKENWSNSHDEPEKRRDSDTPCDEMESLHWLLKVELQNKEGPLPSTGHRPDLGLNGKIKLFLFLGWIFGL